MLGVLVCGTIVATTLYADAQFGSQRLSLRPNGIRLVSQRQELAGLSVAFIEAKCASTESVLSGGYDLVIRGADPTKVSVLSALPDPGINGYKVYVANSSSTSILVFSYAGCVAR